VPARSRSHRAIERSEVTEGLLRIEPPPQPETLRGLIVEELTIYSDVSLPDVPDVVVTGKLGAFLEDELDGRKRRRRLGGQGGSDKRQATSTRMPDVVFPNDSDGGGPRMIPGGWVG
jgi:hypothetical protein